MRLHLLRGSVPDGPTDLQTDGRTDLQTDGQTLLYRCKDASKKPLIKRITKCYKVTKAIATECFKAL